MESHFPDMQAGQSREARERVMADLEALAGSAEALLEATASDASDKARQARAQLSTALEKAQATYQSLKAQGLEAARAAAQRTDETIRSRPYESIAIALGVGLLVGALLRRK